MRIIWLDIAKAISIPLAVGFLAFITNLTWLLGGSVILLAPFLAYTRLNLLTKQDFRDLAEAILPRKLTESIYERFSWIIGILYGTGQNPAT